jgi:hypothetical protein
VDDVITKRRFLVVLVLTSLAIALVIWNHTRPTLAHSPLPYVATWQRNFRSAVPSFAKPLGASNIALSPEGIDTLLRRVREATTPSHNPWHILWMHALYWGNDALFPVSIWIHDPAWTDWIVYYQRGRHVFLRRANPWHNAVLAIDMTPADLEALLRPFVIIEEPIRRPLPAESEPPADQR